MQYSFVITQDCIDNGTQCHPHFCALSLAAEKRFNRAVKVETHYILIYPSTRYAISAKLSTWLQGWDSDKESVEPIRVVLSDDGIADLDEFYEQEEVSVL